jgi:predicted ATPase
VLIGPNGSGKSNLLEAIDLLRSAPTDLRPVVSKGGGVGEWIWKGSSEGTALIDVVVENGRQPLRHVIGFRSEGQAFRIDDERIENEKAYPSDRNLYSYYRFDHGRPVIVQAGAGAPRMLSTTRILGGMDNFVDPDLSILAQRRDPVSFAEITHLATTYDRIRLYREWEFGRNAVFRTPQKADLRTDRLEEDFSNLGLFLNRLSTKRHAKLALLDRLKDLYEGISDFGVSVEGGTAQVFFIECDFTLPATRLSDATLRYLCLLAILCDPEPPPFIGIEEPELGLHPDLIPTIADLLIEASRRTQLVVTTHSDILVDALSGDPESVVICEKHNGQTRLERLELHKLKDWLTEYRLGQLWTRGSLGGSRW